MSGAQHVNIPSNLLMDSDSNNMDTTIRQRLSNIIRSSNPDGMMCYPSQSIASNFPNTSVNSQPLLNYSYVPRNSVNMGFQPSFLSPQTGFDTVQPEQTIANTTDQGNLEGTGNDNRKVTKGLVCSQDVMFVGEVQKPELNDKSTDIIFVRENYNRSGLVCLTPNKKLRNKRQSPYARSISLDSATEFKVTISQKQGTSNATAPATEWTYVGMCGLKTFDVNTASLLEYLFNSGPSSSSDITVTLPETGDTYKVDLQIMKMVHTVSGEEILLSRKPCVREDIEPPSLSVFPAHWSPQTNDIQLVALNEVLNTSEWTNIVTMMQRSLPSLQVERIERVQNKKLWIRYEFQKAMLMDKNGVGDDVNEKLLFHGTKANPPCRIWQSEDGFDMRYCERGAWGLGTYFAVKAAYSNNYAHRPYIVSPIRQMFVASVLTGHSKDMLADMTLRRPPVRIPGTSSNPEILYDSVTGISCKSRIYIMYKFDMAYPSYLVTYSA